MCDKKTIVVEGSLDVSFLEKIVDINIDVKEIKYYSKDKVVDHKRGVVGAIVDYYIANDDNNLYGIVDRDCNNLDDIISKYLDIKSVSEEDKIRVWNKAKDHIFTTDARDLETTLLATQRDLYKKFNLSKEEYKQAIFIARQLLKLREMLVKAKNALNDSVEKGNKLNGADREVINFKDEKYGCIYCGQDDEEYRVDFDKLIDSKYGDDKIVISLKSFCQYVCDVGYVLYTYISTFNILNNIYSYREQKKDKKLIYPDKEASKLKVLMEDEYKDCFTFWGEKKDKNKMLKFVMEEYDTFDIDTISDDILLKIMREIRGHDLLTIFEYLHRTILTFGNRGGELSLINKYDMSNFYKTNLARRLIEEKLLKK